MEAPTQVYLGTGELIFATTPCQVKTILGSCVGVALHDPRNRWGGLCHYLLALDPDLDAAAGGSSRFGEVAIPALVSKLVRAGSRRRDLVAVVAGGALLLDANEVFFVGEKNVRLADTLLRDLGIRIAYRDIGGDRGRRMSFRTDEGTYLIEALQETDPDTLTF
jgi:chemotaxis protein CheD